MRPSRYAQVYGFPSVSYTHLDVYKRQEFCRRGLDTAAVDTAAYSEVLAQCYVETDAAAVDADEVADALARLSALASRCLLYTSRCV